MPDDILIHVSKYHGDDRNDGKTRQTAVQTGNAVLLEWVRTIEHGDQARLALETSTGEWEYI